MPNYQNNNGRESFEIITTTTMVPDMPPSYEIAIVNETASHQKRPNHTKTEYQKIFYSKDYEIVRLENELQRLYEIISKNHKLLEFNSEVIRKRDICILISIMLFFIILAQQIYIWDL